MAKNSTPTPASKKGKPAPLPPQTQFDGPNQGDFWLNDAELDALLAARHGNPFAILGPHTLPDGRVRLLVLEPGASQISAILADSEIPMVRVRDAGMFAVILPSLQPYQLRISRNGYDWVGQDAFRFGPSIPQATLDAYLAGNTDAYWQVLGAHPAEMDGVGGYRFAVWAPHAWRVALVGPFNAWDGRTHPMRKRHEAGLWEIFIPNLVAGELYKFEIIAPDGSKLPLKADPVAFWAEHRPETASRCAPEPKFGHDHGNWFDERGARNGMSAPVSVYEMHLGSWRHQADQHGNHWPMSYRDIAQPLVEYLTHMGFTHVQFLPLSEHPFDGSWGYQSLGLFAPTARFGTPEDFAFLVASLHKAGIGVLCDFVPAHFPTDAHGMMHFDGTPLYAPEDPRRGFHPDWNTAIYDFTRPEVRRFLTAAAMFWLKVFGIDGLRVDAVSSMLYLDYSRKEGEWLPNVFGGNTNLEAVDFLKSLNTTAYLEAEGIMMVAEESTAWGGVSKPVYDGGLGFGYKWNMGWMHDTLEYFKRAPIHRAWHHHDITFSLVYAFSENFILALSHDEVVHGKGSLLTKMGGDNDWEKFASLRALYCLMWFHPGKKLLFMGQEFAQWREWNHNQSLDWHLTSAAPHKGVMDLVRDLNHLYRATPALHKYDHEGRGFGWVKEHAAAESVFAFCRYGDAGEICLAVLNMTPVVRDGYRLGVPQAGNWRVIHNSDAEIYGGSGLAIESRHHTTSGEYDGYQQSIALTLPPIAGLLLVWDGP